MSYSYVGRQGGVIDFPPEIFTVNMPFTAVQYRFHHFTQYTIYRLRRRIGTAKSTTLGWPQAPHLALGDCQESNTITPALPLTGDRRRRCT